MMLAMAVGAVPSVACARFVVVWRLTLHAMAVQGLLGRKKKTYKDLVNEFNKPGMAHSLELLCRAMVASEMVQQQGSQKLLAELKTAMPGKFRQGPPPVRAECCLKVLCLLHS